jgi:hypothetical protein
MGADAMERQVAHDFGVVLMLAAVASAISNVVGTLVDVGRAAGLWP